MALKTGGGLETVSYVLTAEQAGRIRELRDRQKAPHNRVTLSDIAREVVQVGLDHLSCARLSDNVASDEVNEEAA